MNGSIQRLRISEQVSQLLCEEIVNGRLQPGDALPSERTLARTFKVSVPVIREGIRILSAKGLVNVRHGVGTFVSSHDRWNSAEPLSLLMRREESTLLCVHEVRAKLETEIAELAAMRATPDQLGSVADALARMASSLDAPEEHCSADLDFHMALARATGNPMFAVVLQPITTLILTGIVRGSALPEAMERGVREHRALYECVLRRDPAGARVAMVAHMQTSHDELLVGETVSGLPISNAVPSTALRPEPDGDVFAPLSLPQATARPTKDGERRRAGSRERSI